MASDISLSNSSTPQETPGFSSEENPNLQMAIFVAKVGCVGLAALVVVGFVLAVSFSGAWAVVIPSMVLYAVATVAYPFALHILCEASLGEASLSAQRGGLNSNTQDAAENKRENRSKTTSQALPAIRSKENMNLISEQKSESQPYTKESEKSRVENDGKLRNSDAFGPFESQKRAALDELLANHQIEDAVKSELEQVLNRVFYYKFKIEELSNELKGEASDSVLFPGKQEDLRNNEKALSEAENELNELKSKLPSNKNYFLSKVKSVCDFFSSKKM